MNEFYTLENLSTSIQNNKPARFAVIGKPVAHSASPQLHQSALDALGINASYIRLQVEPGTLKEAFGEMKRLGFIGCNITVPHKIEALTTCCEISDQARQLGAVNTVHFKEGKTLGYNTDGPGFVRAISDSFHLNLREIHTLILGAGGGAGQAISTQCALSQPSRLTLVNRDLNKILLLADQLKTLAPSTSIRCLNYDDPELKSLCLESELIVQTTSLGLKDSDQKVIPRSFFPSGQCAYDTIYQPATTPFLADAQLSGCVVDNGFSLLIHQGALAFQIWFPGTNPLVFMKNSMGK